MIKNSYKDCSYYEDDDCRMYECKCIYDKELEECGRLYKIY